MTSLAKQLQRLAVPHTQSLLAQDKRRPSLLFDPKEAATLDREAVHALGVSGLEELENLDAAFIEFENNLFNKASQNWERSQQTAEINAQLDSTISHFLIRLSPYFLLKSAHKTLEWLIYRYHIHQYNIDELMQCVLPYHETRIFVRVIQLLPINEPTNKWHWLKPSADGGAPLARSTLINHCVKDPGFLNFLSDIIPKYIKVHGATSTQLRALVSFFTCTLLGALQNKMDITEKLVGVLVPTIIRGLKSKCADHKAGAYMVLSQLVNQCQLKSEFITSLLPVLTKHLKVTLMKEGLLCLTLIYQTQNVDKLPKKSFKHLCRVPGVAALLATLSEDYEIAPLLSVFLERLVPVAVKTSASEASSSSADSGGELSQELPNHEDLLHAVISDVKFSEKLASQITRMLLIELLTLRQRMDIDDENNEDHSPWQHHAKMLLGQMERKYAGAFDKAMEAVLGEITSNEDKEALQDVLALTSVGVKYQIVPGSSTSLMLALNHPKPSMRVLALQHLSRAESQHQDLPPGFLSDMLLARLDDDKPKVVKATLELKELLLKVIEPATLGGKLMNLIKSRRNSARWKQVSPLCIKLICTEPISGAIHDLEVELLSLLLATSPSIHALSIPHTIFKTAGVAQLPILGHVSQGWLGLYEKLGVSPEAVTSGSVAQLNVYLIKSVAQSLTGMKWPSCFKLVTCMSEKCTNDKPMQMMTSLILSEIIELKKDNHPEILTCLLKLIQISVKISQKVHVEIEPAVSMDSGMMNWCALLNMADGVPLPAVAYIIGKLLGSIKSFTKLPDDTDIWWSMSDAVVGGMVQVVDLLMRLSCSHDNKAAAQSSIWQQMLTKCFQETLSATQTSSLLSLMWTQPCNAGHVSPVLHVGSMYLLAHRWRTCSAEDIVTQFVAKSPVLASLLMSLLHPHVNVRQAALTCFQTAKKHAGSHLGAAAPLVKKIVKRQEEILADPEHVPYVLANVLRKASATGENGVLDVVEDYITEDTTPVYVKERLLQCLQATPHDTVPQALLPVGEAMLDVCEAGGERVTDAHLGVLQHVLARIDADTAHCLTPDSAALKFFRRTLKVVGGVEGQRTPQIMAMEQVVRPFFLALPSVKIQQQIVSTILDAAESASSVDTINQAQKTLRQLKLEVAHVSHELQPGADQDAKTVKSRRRSRSAGRGVKLSWKRLTILLEVLQARKSVTESEQLVMFLFKLLSSLFSSEEDEETEYRKNLVLSCMYNMTSRWTDDQIQPKQENFDMAVLVQCVRGGNSSATQQQALMVMASVAKFFPEYILHNVMLIFTFVGTGLLAQDDSHSFQIITHAIQTVIPALLQARQSSSVGDDKLESLIAGILQVFVDARNAVPRHRCRMVFRTLTQTLGADDYLWLVLTLLVGSSVRTREVPPTSDDPEAAAIFEGDMDFAVDTSEQFPVGVQTHALVQILSFLQKLTDCHQGQAGRSEKAADKKVGAIDVTDLDAKQLRLFQFHLTKLVSAILVKESYVTQVVNVVSGEESDHMNVEGPDFHTFVQEALCYLVKVAKAYGTLGQKSVGRFWKALLNKIYEVLDKVNYLLPLPMLLEVVSSLVQHPLISVRRKALDLLNSKLQHLTLVKLSESEVTSLLMLVDILTSLAEEKHLDEADSIATCQMALFSLKLLCKLLGASHPKTFTKLFPMTIALIKKKELAAEVLGSDLLCIAELCTTLKAHAIPYLSAFIPPLLKILRNQEYLATHELVLTCGMTCLHRVVLSLPLFLSPYLTEILLAVCKLGLLDNLDDPAKKTQPSLRLKAIRHQLATTVAARVLIPALGDCFNQLLKTNQPSSLIALMLIAQEHVETLSREDLSAQHSPLLAFFTQTLDARNTSDLSQDDVEAVENAVINACLGMVVRLSEASFRPMFYKLYDWACRDDSDVSKNRKLTFFKLADKLAGKLRSLFNLFVRHTLQAASKLLDANNTIHRETNYFPGDSDDYKSCLLLTHILSCLTQCMAHDTEGLFKKDVFNLLLKPLVDQIENTCGGDDAFRSRIVDHVSPCLSQFAVAAQDDTSWKMLNYQVLLKMRHSSSQVRFAALQVVESIAQKLGEEYMVLIPETIPFLAELMEDEVEEVEHRCQQVIATLEQVLGESLQKYF